MIAKLTGTVEDVGADSLIMDVGGVGYLVQASGRTLSEIGRGGTTGSLLIETVVREDAITLFGFINRDERDMFRLLTSVQGVGAKVGLAILSVLAPADLHTAIAAQDKAALGRANGVGPKLAGRIVNELKDKVAGIAFGTLKAVSGQTGAAAAVSGLQAAGSLHLEEVTSALVNLGYRPSEAYTAAAKAVQAAGENAGLDALIPAALKELAN